MYCRHRTYFLAKVALISRKLYLKAGDFQPFTELINCLYKLQS